MVVQVFREENRHAGDAQVAGGNRHLLVF